MDLDDYGMRSRSNVFGNENVSLDFMFVHGFVGDDFDVKLSPTWRIHSDI